MKALLTAFGFGAALAGAAFAAVGDPGVFVVRPAMQQEINQATNDIWAVGNAAMDDNGGIDPARMDDAGWTKLQDAAAALEAEALKMQHAKVIHAARPGHSEDVELGSFSLEDVQGYIDRDPQAFRDLAGALVNHAERLKRAADNRDAATAGPLVGGLEGVCEACHAKYWYPEG
jgi:cytochrome c556